MSLNREFKVKPQILQLSKTLKMLFKMVAKEIAFIKSRKSLFIFKGMTGQ